MFGRARCMYAPTDGRPRWASRSALVSLLAAMVTLLGMPRAASAGGDGPPPATEVRWINPTGGEWFIGENWDNGEGPGSNDIAIFDLDATYEVTLEFGSPFVRGLRVERGTVTINEGVKSQLGSGSIGLGPEFGEPAVVIGTTPGATARLVLRDVDLVEDGAGGVWNIGTTAGATGELVLGAEPFQFSNAFVTPGNSTIRLGANGDDPAGTGRILVNPFSFFGNGFDDTVLVEASSEFKVDGGSVDVGVLEVRGRLGVDDFGQVRADTLAIEPTAVLDVLVPFATAQGKGDSSAPISIEALASVNGGAIFLRYDGGPFPPGPGAEFLIIENGQGDVNGDFETVESDLFGPFGEPLDRIFQIEAVPQPGTGNRALAAVVTLVETPALPEEPVFFGGLPAGEPTDSAFGDITRDGQPDLVIVQTDAVRGQPGQLLVLPNGGVDETGTWQNWEGVEEYETAPEPSALAIADFDGINGLDVVVASFSEDTIRLYLNDGTGTLVPQPDIPVLDEPIALDAGDVTGDGRPDIAIAERATDLATGRMRILANQETIILGLSFTEFVSFTLSARPLDVDLGDLDNDKDLDLVVAAVEDDTINGGFPIGGGLGPQGADFVIAVGPGVNTVAVADIDEDGDGDIVTGNDGMLVLGELRSTLTILERTGAGSFTRRDRDFPFDIVSLAATDLESDGDLDLVLVAGDGTTSPGRSVHTVLNTDDPDQSIAFAAPVQLNSEPNPRLATRGIGPGLLLDVDGDGDTDPIVVNGDLPGSVGGDEPDSVTCYVNETAEIGDLPGILFGPVVNPDTGQTYFLLEPSGWIAARVAAVQLGGDLPTVTDAGENAWIRTALANAVGPRRVWLGYNDVQQEGLFRWVAGDPPGFENFATGEPTGLAGENFVWLDPVSGLWFDDVEEPASLAGPPVVPSGIVEVPADLFANAMFNPCTDSFYVVDEPATWLALATRATSLGAQLITVDDAGENEWVRRNVNVEGDRRLWLGLNDLVSEGEFVWRSGAPVEFLAWAPGEPSGGLGEDVVEMGADGLWSDELADELRSGAFEIAAIRSVIDVPTSAFPTIQSAIDAAANGQLVRIAPGIYNERIDLLGKSIIVEGAGQEQTILSGAGLSGAVVTAQSGETERTVLRDLTIANGQGIVAGGARVGFGSRASFVDVTFRDNMAVGFGFGGALNVYQGGGVVCCRCTFENNHAMYAGGAVVAGVAAEVVLEDSIFRSNRAEADGGAVLSQQSSALEIRRCRFEGNEAIGGGGAIALLFGSDAEIENTIFSGNHAVAGGACFSEAASPRLRFCALVDNTASLSGPALQIGDGTLTIESSVVAFHAGPAIAAGTGGSAAITFSNIAGGAPGAGNIDADPLFVDRLGPDGIAGTGDEDLRVPAGSPHVDAGTGDGIAVAVDLSFVHRRLDGDGDGERVPDIGPHELEAPLTCPEDVTGDGVLDIRDVDAIVDNLGATDGAGMLDVDGDGLVGPSDLRQVVEKLAVGCGG